MNNYSCNNFIFFICVLVQVLLRRSNSVDHMATQPHNLNISEKKGLILLIPIHSIYIIGKEKNMATGDNKLSWEFYISLNRHAVLNNQQFFVKVKVKSDG